MSKGADYSAFELAYHCLSEAIVMADDSGTICYYNPAFGAEFGYSPGQLHGQNVKELLADTQQLAQTKEAQVSLSQTGHWQGKVWIATYQSDPVIRPVQIDTVMNPKQQVLGYIARINDKGHYLENNAALQELAYHDELTGLANRALFNQLLKHEISLSQRLDNRFALLFIDLDRFKQVNDNLGHDAGDVLLCNISERLQKSLRKSDVVARLGGDEFVVIMNNIKDSETVATVAEKLIRQIQKPVKFGANILEVGCSVGISIFPDNGIDAEHLMHHADAAMYRAKQQGGAHYFYFSEELNRELQDTRRVEQEIIDGLAAKQFVPYFQPLIDQRSGQLVGIECLARWLTSGQQVRSPIEFIPIAKKVGLMHDILVQVLHGAFKSLQQWNLEFQCLVPMAVNITSKQFYQQNTFDELSSLLAQYGLSTENIRIEVTESTLQEKGEALIDQLKKISNAGFSVTLDDLAPAIRRCDICNNFRWIP